MMDLPPSKDPKGGSPRSPPRGIMVREYQQHVDETIRSNHVASFWKTIALVLLTANISGIGSWIVFGTNNVKRYDLDQMDFVKHSQLSERISRLNKEDTDISRWNNIQNDKRFEELHRRVDALEKYHQDGRENKTLKE